MAMDRTPPTSEATVSTSPRHVELLVIGAGPAGRRAAIEGARLGARTTMVERGPHPGAGLPFRARCTPPRPTRSSPFAHAPCAPASARRRWPTCSGARDRVVNRRRDAVRDELRRERVEVVAGDARFAGPHAIDVPAGRHDARDGRPHRDRAGTVPRRAPGVNADGRVVLSPEEVPHLRELPPRLTVVGAGIPGLEIASVAARWGSR